MNVTSDSISISQDIDALAEEMAELWRKGQRILANEILDRHPSFWTEENCVLELLAEELALRHEYQIHTDEVDLARRFPAFTSHIPRLLECQRILENKFAAVRFPEPGGRIGEFEILRELGRGAFGRVYLAKQNTLLGRPVVLKINPISGSEHLSLARLQHTHIVPIYSAVEFPELNVRVLCMPFFGGQTLQSIFVFLDHLQTRERTGRDVQSAIERSDFTQDSQLTSRGPAWFFLSRATFEEVVCWIGACLADALQYAHDRGVLHFDLKPSNILIAADGIPMLLDFHLARPPLVAGESPIFSIGGTPGYMAPEHAGAIQAIRDGNVLPQSVDGRVDIYSLGITLLELQSRGERDSRGLQDILAKCTAEDVSNRYATPRELAEDLRRQLGDLPLKGVRNRSGFERFQKWRRRHPYALPLLFAVLALLVGMWGGTRHILRLNEQAHAAYRDGMSFISENRLDEANENFHRGLLLINGLPFHAELRNRLTDGKERADREKSVIDLHNFVERIRPYFDPDISSESQSRVLIQRCMDVWSRRQELERAITSHNSEDKVQSGRNDLLDLILLINALDTRQADREKLDLMRKNCLMRIQEAEALLGSCTVITLEQKRLQSDQQSLSAESLSHANAISLRAWDHLAMGRMQLTAGRFELASAEFEQSLEREPQSVWANYYLGISALKQKRPHVALAAFSACAALAPQEAWCIYNRGLALEELGQREDALANLKRALILDPQLLLANLGRAELFRKAGQYQNALDELSAAESKHGRNAEIDFHKALVLLTMERKDEAAKLLNQILSQSPNDAKALQLMKSIQP